MVKFGLLSIVIALRHHITQIMGYKSSFAAAMQANDRDLIYETQIHILAELGSQTVVQNLTRISTSGT